MAAPHLMNIERMKKVLSCTYRYDPLNRISSTQHERQSSEQRFYCQSRIATHIQGSTQHSILQYGDQLLGQLTQGQDLTNTLLATDAQRSVLHATSSAKQQTIAYSPFGHTPATSAHHLLGFNGELTESTTGHYLLGNGYRAFNTVLMRFNSPDSWSPFGRGGINTYAYCMNNPVLSEDSSGHFSTPIMKKIMKWANRARKNILSGNAPFMNVRAQGDTVVPLKIKSGVSVKNALSARERMITARKLIPQFNAVNAIFINDLEAATSSLNLQNLAAATVKKHNISLDTLPRKLKTLVAESKSASPYPQSMLDSFKKINHDPHSNDPKTSRIFNDRNPLSHEELEYRISLGDRGSALSNQQYKLYGTLLDAHFIRG